MKLQKSSAKSLQKQKQRSCYLSKGVINGIAATGIAIIIMFIQGNLHLKLFSHNSILLGRPQKEDDVPASNTIRTVSLNNIHRH